MKPHINPRKSFCVLGLLTKQKKVFKTNLEVPETEVYYKLKK